MISLTLSVGTWNLQGPCFLPLLRPSQESPIRASELAGWSFKMSEGELMPGIENLREGCLPGEPARAGVGVGVGSSWKGSPSGLNPEPQAGLARAVLPEAHEAQ